MFVTACVTFHHNTCTIFSSLNDKLAENTHHNTMKSLNSSVNWPDGRRGGSSLTTCLSCSNGFPQVAYGNLPVASSIWRKGERYGVRTDDVVICVQTGQSLGHCLSCLLWPGVSRVDRMDTFTGLSKWDTLFNMKYD